MWRIVQRLIALRRCWPYKLGKYCTAADAIDRVAAAYNLSRLKVPVSWSSVDCWCRPR